MNNLVEEIHFDWFKIVKPTLNDAPQATLIIAPANTELQSFCTKLVASWLCKESYKGVCCQKCETCISIFNGTYPDLICISPPTKDTAEKVVEEEIKINEIRSLKSFFNLSSHYEKRNRFLICGSLQMLNFTAINALLKILEEPPNTLRFLFFTYSLFGIPKTLVSRCQKISFSISNSDYIRLGCENCNILSWLLPFLRRGEELNPVIVASKADKFPPHDIITRVVMWMHDVSRCYLDQKPISFPGETLALKKTSKKIASLKNWVSTEWEIFEMLKVARHPLNKKLFFEAVFIKFRGGFD